MNFLKDWNMERIWIVLILIFLWIFFFSFLYMQTRTIKYRKIIFPIDDSIPRYQENQDKYKINECKDLCNHHVCREYKEQNQKYDLCKKCEQKGLCYQPFGGGCEPCIQKKSCEEAYGCDGGSPIDPMKQECKKCWAKIY